MTNVNSPQQQTVLHLLSGHRLFAALPPALVGALARHAELEQAGAGALLFHEGAPARHCLLVAHGEIELLRYSVDGDERVFKAFGAGQLVAEFAMFMPHGRYPMHARARGDVTAYRLPRAALRQACEADPMLAMRMLESLSERLYRSVNEVEWLTASSAPQRLAAYLLEQQQGQGGEGVELPLSQRQLAGRLGMRAETLSRLFSEWSQRAYISGRQRKWQLANLAFLRGLASGSVRSF